LLDAANARLQEVLDELGGPLENRFA
jgi:hypothetical protein